MPAQIHSLLNTEESPAVIFCLNRFFKANSEFRHFMSSLWLRNIFSSFYFSENCCLTSFLYLLGIHGLNNGKSSPPLKRTKAPLKASSHCVIVGCLTECERNIVESLLVSWKGWSLIAVRLYCETCTPTLYLELRPPKTACVYILIVSEMEDQNTSTHQTLTQNDQTTTMSQLKVLPSNICTPKLGA